MIYPWKTDTVKTPVRLGYRWNSKSSYRFCHRCDTDTDEIPIRYLSRTIWNSYPPWTELFRTRLWTCYGENEQTVAESWAFSRPRLAVGGASERRITAKWANGCRVALIFGIVQNLGFIKVFGPVATSISRKRSNGCRVVRILILARPSRQDRDAFGQDDGKMSQSASR